MAKGEGECTEALRAGPDARLNNESLSWLEDPLWLADLRLVRRAPWSPACPKNLRREKVFEPNI